MDETHLPEKKQFARIDVRGKTLELWPSLRPKLIKAMNDVLDAVIDDKHGTTVRDEVKQFTTALLGYGKAKLERPPLENERIEAEVRRLYEQMEIDRAEARKKHAEADTLEFNNKVRRLRLVLGATKALMVGEEGEEAVIFTEQITALLETLEKLASS
jgi:hypothetical protein